MFRLIRLLPKFLIGQKVTRGCLSFCTNIFTLQEVARGSFRILRMFRLFKLLRKLSRGAKFSGTWQFQDVQAVQACTQTSPDLVLKHLLVSFTQAMVPWEVALLNGQRFEVDGTGSFVIIHQLSQVYQRV
jgi:hypothetical protein